MRLDHVSYVASQNEISSTVNRIGSLLQTPFVDGGVHPRFGTRNFTAPLLNNQYVEVVCPMDHPSTDSTPFGRAVKAKSENGGGWFAWVLATTNISELENLWQRKAADGLRVLPDGKKLEWKQIGVLGTAVDANRPFFVEWKSQNHPSSMGIAKAKLVNIFMNGSKNSEDYWNKIESNQFGVKIDLQPNDVENPSGIAKIEFQIGENKVIVE